MTTPNNKIQVSETSPFPALTHELYAKLNLDRQTGGKGILADAIGIGSEEVLAVQRHARRLESKDTAAALKSYQVAIMLAPETASNWRGLARCYQALGNETQTRIMNKIADRLETATAEKN